MKEENAVIVFCYPFLWISAIYVVKSEKIKVDNILIIILIIKILIIITTIFLCIIHVKIIFVFYTRIWAFNDNCREVGFKIDAEIRCVLSVLLSY